MTVKFNILFLQTGLANIISLSIISFIMCRKRMYLYRTEYLLSCVEINTKQSIIHRIEKNVF